MISAESLCEQLTALGIDGYIGVPDSLLKDFCAFVSTCNSRHIIAANEGNAVAIAAGRFLGTGRPSLVYMQNSGIGNAVNPLLSLTDPDVYGIPLMLMIGWRGEPGTKDEPQHVKQGKVTLKLLESMDIPFIILDPGASDNNKDVERLYREMIERSGPVAIVVRSGSFQSCKCDMVHQDYPLTREQALETIVDLMGENDVVVSTTGKASRELYEIRENREMGHSRDFLTVGSMGHASSIAFGLASTQTEKRVFCIDGDGAMLMHMGAMAIIGQSSVQNLVHIVLNNGSHESVGGQPTVGYSLDMISIAKSCGYRNAYTAEDKDQLTNAMNISEGPVFIEVRVKCGSRADLGRPKTSPNENMQALMRFMGSLQ